MSERKLKQWADAGLIDAATLAAIRDYEKAHARPLGLWALIGLGALAIGLGLISVVAANWDAIIGEVRLAIHFALLLALGGFLWWRGQKGEIGNAWFHDASLFILAALGLTFFGHIGQVYQTSSPLWQPMALWLLLFTPLLLGYGRGWLVAALWFVGLVYTVQAYLDHINVYSYDDSVPVRFHLITGLLSAAPVLVTGIAAWWRARSRRPDFWRRLEQLALIYAVGGASIAIITGSLNELFGGRNGNVSAKLGVAACQMAVALVTAVIVWVSRRTRSGEATAGVLAIAGMLTMIAAGAGSFGLFLGLLFMALWGAIAALSLYAGWRIVFQIAIAVLAIRLIILSFELASDLLGSGLGLILAGIATLGIAWLAVNVSRTYAPKEEAGQ
jgi:hypothetical protein